MFDFKAASEARLQRLIPSHLSIQGPSGGLTVIPVGRKPSAAAIKRHFANLSLKGQAMDDGGPAHWAPLVTIRRGCQPPKTEAEWEEFMLLDCKQNEKERFFSNKEYVYWPAKTQCRANRQENRR